MGELMHMGFKCFARRIRHDAQADLSARVQSCPQLADDHWHRCRAHADCSRGGAADPADHSVSRFFPRILKHLVGFSMLVGQWGLRLQRTGTLMGSTAQIQNGLRTDLEFCREGDGGLALQDPTQDATY